MTSVLVSVLALATALANAARRDQPTPAVPFGVGERFTYDVKLGPFKAGRGSMEITGTDTIRGRTAYRAVFRVKGGILGYHADNTMESWIDTATIVSLRFTQDFEQTGKDRKKFYEIYPERAVYQEPNKPEQPSVPDPLDDASFIYFVRTVPLEIRISRNDANGSATPGTDTNGRSNHGATLRSRRTGTGALGTVVRSPTTISAPPSKRRTSSGMCSG